MVGLLIRMNLAMQRNTLNGAAIFWLVVGILLAAGTIMLSMVRSDSSRITVDLLSAAFAAWLLFLALAPIFGRGSGGVKIEHLALLPLRSRTLALGLLGTAAVGLVPAVALLAFTALVVYGLQLGAVPALISVIALFLQFTLVVLLGRIVYGVMGQAMQSRIGMELVAIQFALLFSGVSVGWFLIRPFVEQTSRLLTEGWPQGISTFFRLLPSGWGLVAVEAASRRDWTLALGALLGLIALIGVLLWLWTVLLQRSIGGRSSSRMGRGSEFSPLTFWMQWLPATPVSAVIVKELNTWRRDPWRALESRIAIWTGLLIGLMPLAIGIREVLPFAGIVIILMAGIVSGNLYALDGSAIWQTVLTPGSERLDVRGRQWAWLLLFGPVSLLVTVIFTALSGFTWAWTLVLAFLPVAIGVNAGLVPLFSILFPSPGIDPQHRRNPMDSTGGAIGGLFLMPIAATLAAAPALLLVINGVEPANPALQLAGVIVGIITGVLSAWLLGWLAHRRLASQGAEIFNLLLKGSTPKANVAAAEQDDKENWKTMPLWKRVVVLFCQCVFWLPLFPQGIVPLVMKLFGMDTEVRSWFIALYLPPELQWPFIFAMIAIGGAMTYLMIQIPRQHKMALRQQAVAG